MSTFGTEKAGLTDLDEVLELFDMVQAWLVARGLVGQWGDVPFSKSPAQRDRFAAWLGAGSLFVVRIEERIVGALVFSSSPPDYARAACADREGGGYLEAFAVHRGCAGQGVGAALLGWAAVEAMRRGLGTLHLDCWAESGALRRYYRRAGFREVGTLTVGAWQGTLLEKALRSPPP